jgi:hypothetical protein
MKRKGKEEAYPAAPTTERPMQSVMPKEAHTWGCIFSRKAPTCISLVQEVKRAEEY